MLGMSRRNFIITAATAGAAFGLDGPLEIIAPAQAQKAPTSDPGFLKYAVGEFEAFALHDGFAERPLTQEFVKNAPIDQLSAAAKSGGNDEGKLRIPFTMTALRKGGKTILFDTGTGGQLTPTAGKLMESVKAAGIDPASISTVVISHFHGDHILGLMNKENQQVFANAEILMPEVEYKFWTDPALIEKLPEAARGLPKRIQATFPTWKNIRQYAWGKEILPGVTAVETAGHTPGHTSFLVADGGKQLMIQSDVTNVHYLFVRNPGWHAMFDMDGAKAEAARRKLYDQMVADKTMTAGYHWGMPNVGTIAKDGTGYVFTPIAG